MITEQFTISKEQLTEFQENGYCIVDDVFSSNELQDIEDYFEDYRKQGHRTFASGNSQGMTTIDQVDATKIQVRAMHVHRTDPKVLNWMIHPNIAASLETFMQKPALAGQTMYYYKPPGARGQAMHQDNFYLLAKPATCMGAWTPIDDATEENGCLWIVPGSHRCDILCPDSNLAKDRWLEYGDGHISKFPAKPVPVPVMRGQTLFFGGNVIHGSGPNRSKTRSRRTFIGHYIDHATDEISHHYFPIYNMQGEIVEGIKVNAGGGPCGDGWRGDVH